MLRLVHTPETGGNTIWSSQTALYEKPSPHFQNLSDRLQAVHTSEHGYVNAINRGTQPFRVPVRQMHPLVRTHPVARVKSLFYNSAFNIHIEGLKGAESLHVLDFLREYAAVPGRHLHTADDLTVRWKWEPGSVAFWENRVVAHRAVPGGYNPEEREGKRTAICGERPYFDPVDGIKLRDYCGKPDYVDDERKGEVDIATTPRNGVRNRDVLERKLRRTVRRVWMRSIPMSDLGTST